MRPRRPFLLIPTYTHGLTRSEFRRLPKTERIGAMVEWFSMNFEDPAMSTPQCPASVTNASFGVVSRKQSSLVVTPSSKEATGSVIEANLDPRGTRPLIFALFDCLNGALTGVLTGQCDRSRVGIGVTTQLSRWSDGRESYTASS